MRLLLQTQDHGKHSYRTFYGAEIIKIQNLVFFCRRYPRISSFLCSHAELFHWDFLFL